MQAKSKHAAMLRVVVAVSLAIVCAVANNVVAENPPAEKPTTAPSAAPQKRTPPAPPRLPEPKGATRLDEVLPVWIDMNEKTVLVDGQISLREGMLEMFACTRNTKEHESIVSAFTKAKIVHAGLLRLGAESGTPVQFRPSYKPPTGTEIDVLIRWVDEKGKPHEDRAQDWIKDLKTGKPMAYPFVFAGSGFWTDPDTGKQHYQAEGGDFVCVSNFGTAMLDIPVKSSQSNDELEFQALTEKIPPLGAPVRLVFKPKLGKHGAGSGEQGVGKKKNEGEQAKKLTQPEPKAN
jgi:hypothetical protein